MKGIKFIFLLFAVVFGGVGVGMFFGFILPSYKDQNVAKNGTPAIATFDGYASNSSVNDEPMYYIRFTYTDESGNQIQAKSVSAYNLYEALSFEEAGNFNIKHKDGRAVIDPYKKSSFANMAWIFVLAFGAVGVGMSIAFVVAIKRDAFDRKAKKHGVDAIGIFLHKSSNVTVNGSPLYKIHFTFTNQEGENIEASTRSIYRTHIAEALTQMGQFGIKYIGKKAIINVDEQEMINQLRILGQQRQSELQERQGLYQQMQQQNPYDPNYFDSKK